MPADPHHSPLILASRSPRRQELLQLFDLAFDIREADIDETPLDGESAAIMTERLALGKARAIAKDLANHWILGGDTTVSIDGDILGKPTDRAEAIHMLERLSGKRHEVISAVALVGPDFVGTDVNVTGVTFIDLTPGMIAQYCDTGEPYDKAGAYGIQGPAGTFVREIHGSYSGVVGLPLYETRMLLQRAGLI